MISGYTRSAKLKWTPTLEQQYEAVKTLGDCQKLFWMDENLPSSCMQCIRLRMRSISLPDSDGKEYPIQFLSSRFLRPETMEYDRTGGVRDFLLAQQLNTCVTDNSRC
jgi:hypothetical protein